MKLYLVKRNTNLHGDVETIFKTDLKINPDLGFGKIQSAVEGALFSTLFWEDTHVNKDGEEVVFRRPKDGNDYIFNIVVDMSDNTYTISVIEPVGKFAFIAIANTIVVTKDGGYIKEEIEDDPEE